MDVGRPRLGGARRLSWLGDGVGVAVLVLGWIGAVLGLDAVRAWDAAEPARQVLLGVGTWAVLAALLRRETGVVRAQTLIVVALATLVEYTFSPLLQAYVYRIGTVPPFVPPGHGLVYLAALALGRSAALRRAPRVAVGATLVIGGGWALAGVLTAARSDVLGAFWFGCLALFLVLGRSRLLYVGAFVVVSYLELLGTHLGTWAWAGRDPVLGVVTQGNPPSGAAGGYGWFDLYAMWLAPVALRAAAAARRATGWARRAEVAGRRWPARRTPSGRQRAQHRLVQFAVRRHRAAAERPVDAVE